MKHIHPEDPRVTAHALGELPAHEAAEVERAAVANPAIRNGLEETLALAGLIKACYKTESHTLGEARREAIRRAGRQPVAENLVSLAPRRRWLRPVAVTGAAAALVAGTVWMVQQVPRSESGLSATEEEAVQRADLRTEVLLSDAPRPGDPRSGAGATGRNAPVPVPAGRSGDLPAEAVTEEVQSLRDLERRDPDGYREQVGEAARAAALPALAKLPELTDNPFVPAHAHPVSSVPLVSGSASFPLVERFVRTERKLPPARAVRVEELINQVAYEDPGDADFGGIRLGAELVRCPWDTGAILMGVLLHNGSEEVIPSDAILALELQPDLIRSYRLLGYASGPAAGERAGLGVLGGLAPGKSNFVLYQLHPQLGEVFAQPRVLAQVTLRLGDAQAPGLIVPVSSPPRDWETASNNLQTAVALGGWGMLLRNSPYRGTLTAELVERLASESQRGVEDGNLARREALQLVRDSLPMLERRSK